MTEIQTILFDYIDRTLTEDYLRTAEDWFDGGNSLMRRFYRERGRLEDVGERPYRRFHGEVRVAKAECRMEGKEKDALKALETYAGLLSEIEDNLISLTQASRKLLSSGIEVFEIKSVIDKTSREPDPDDFAAPSLP